MEKDLSWLAITTSDPSRLLQYTRHATTVLSEWLRVEGKFRLKTFDIKCLSPAVLLAFLFLMV